ncbi:Sec-independent periplasmic protein translocase [Halorubrum californiense DSM 19288]|uniref:Sec-independent protein translocase protein TatC n=1 Tax=Halorubrum californiense DSM 19288 TaxID=1227465 RepID=M0EIK3_9EURY|nr:MULTISPECIES: twin-arginine translocase subunit TatC [Halorubrum]ELZ47565.1 Sec-independent periplasmic protein translocase [Halorubrum californiense DSM 19288]TKX71733.1 preprotein translocase subunit TatC [Halorubrum sp. GN11GM_10-3_MGM]
MDDSDRSRDDDSAAADGSTDAVDTDGAVDEGSETGASDDGARDPADTDPDGDGSDEGSEPDPDPDGSLEPDEVVAAEDAARAEAVGDDGDEKDAVGDEADDPDDAGDGGADDGGADDGEADDAGDGDPDDDGDAADDAESLGDGGTPATAADGSTADAATAVDGEVTAVDDEPFEGIEGPETDEEMPLAAHIEEMMRRLAVVFLIGGLATLVVVTESTELINYFWSYHIPAPMENRPRLYGPLELPLTQLKVAGLAGVVVGLPAFVFQTYRFMRPGLYQTERRYYLAAVPTSLVLGGIGIAFAHFLVLPAIFSYFTTYTADAATIAFGLAETFNLIVIMLAFMAIVFQIPLFIMLAIMMNLVTRQWLEAKRLIFWGSFLGIAFLFSPDPTGMAPIIVTLTMIALFEGTLAILRWTGN